MALRYRWSQEELEEALAPAIATGEHTIGFDNISDATRFRMACYGLRRRKGIGADLSFILDEASLEVKIKKTLRIKLGSVETKRKECHSL